MAEMQIKANTSEEAIMKMYYGIVKINSPKWLPIPLLPYWAKLKGWELKNYETFFRVYQDKELIATFDYPN